MAIQKWDPIPYLTSFRDEVESLWPWPFLGVAPRGTFVPAVDVYDNDDAIVLKADLAGMRPEDVDIEVHDNVLTIKGERKQEEKTDKGGYHRVERRYGSFERSIALPGGTKVDAIEATCQDGVLTVRVPKTEAKKTEHVQIKASPAGKKSKAA